MSSEIRKRERRRRAEAERFVARAVRLAEARLAALPAEELEAKLAAPELQAMSRVELLAEAGRLEAELVAQRMLA